MPTTAPAAPVKTATAAAPMPTPELKPAIEVPSTAAPATAPDTDPDVAAFEKQMQEWDKKGEPAAKEPAPAKEPEKAKEAPAKAPAKDKEAPKELRARKEQLDGEVTTLNTKIKELEAKIAEAEAKGKDTAALTERLTAREKELEDRDKLIRSLKREVDPKFKEEYDNPIAQAIAYAQQDIQQLTVTDADGNTRAATWDDLDGLYRMPLGKRIETAEQLFGKTAPVVLDHVTQLRRLQDKRAKALDVENKRWETEEQERTANEARQREEMNKLRNEAFKYVEESSEWFKENPDDPEHNELLKKGREWVAKANKTPGEQALHGAEMVYKAAAHDLLISRYEKVKSELDALKAENEELKASGPGTTRRDGGAKPAPSGDEWEDTKREIREAANT